MNTPSDPHIAHLLNLVDALERDLRAVRQYIEHHGLSSPPPSTSAELASAMIKHRTKHNLTQRALASRVGLPVHKITDLENGRRNPTEPDFVAIAAEVGFEGAFVRAPGSRVRRKRGTPPAPQVVVEQAHAQRQRLSIKLSVAIQDFKSVNGETNRTIAKAIGVTTPTVASWACGERLPRHTTYLKIAEYIGCTYDYVFANSAPARQAVSPWDREVLSEYLEDMDVTEEEMAEKLGVTAETVGAWAYGYTLPPASVAAELCALAEAEITFDALTPIKAPAPL